MSLRAANYTSLCEQLGDPESTDDKVDAVHSGRLYIFLSTYVGGDRYVCQNKHDIISILNKVEYHRSSRPRRTSFSYHISCTGNLLYCKKLIREMKAYVCLTELQKRMLPHAHCNFFMTQTSKINLLNPSFIDRTTSAEFPSVQNSLLEQVGFKHNIHNLSAFCMIDNIYFKHFPKDFVDETSDDESQIYVTYRR